MNRNYTQQLILEGLDCANCASKIEVKVNELPEVRQATMNFIMKRLTIELKDGYEKDKVVKQVKEIVRLLEPHVQVKEQLEHSNTHSHMDMRNQHMLIRLTIGIILFIIPIVWQGPQVMKITLYVCSYLLIGGEIVVRAIKNIIHGQIFDENFLMTIATIGAFAIGEFSEGVAVMLFYQIGELFQDMAVNRSRQSITALMDIRPEFAQLKVNGKLVQVSPEDVHVGDIIVIKPGEKVPLDGNVVEGRAMMDTSALTGESIPRNVEVGSEVLSGFINQSGVIEVQVTKEFGESTVSKILELVQNASSRKAKTENFITQFARYYTPFVVIAAALIAIVPPLLLNEATFSTWLYKALVFLVISCPCALVISIPLGFFGGIGAASRNGILVKGSNYLEALNYIETVVFDKTGTLTKGQFRVVDQKNYNGFSQKELLKYAAYAESYSNHPIALSIVGEYGKKIDKEKIQDYEEIAGQGIIVTIDAKRVVAGNDKLMIAEGVKYHNEDTTIGTIVHVAVEGIYVGSIIIADTLKEDAAYTIQVLKEEGIKQTAMLTGDRNNVAQEIGKVVGVDKIYAELLPHEKVQKLEEIEKSKSNGKKVIFVGDGINDAPVLARADVGIAMGGLGSDAAIEAADIVIMTDEPSKVASAIRIARRTRKIVWQNIIFALGVKAIVLLLGVFGIATMWEAVFADVGVSVLAILNAMRVMGPRH